MSPSFAVLAVVAASAAVPEGAVPMENDPSHRLVFQNDYVQAFRVTLPPGKSALMHTHSHDDAAVRLSEATIRAEVLGKPATGPEPIHAASVSARANDGHPYTHRLTNVGTTDFEVIDLQILKRPAGPATAAITTPAAENPQMRVYRWELAPGATSAQHTHARPYVVIAATDLDLRMTSPDGRVMAHAVKAGDLHWVDGSVTHTLGNAGSEKGIMVEIELK